MIDLVAQGPAYRGHKLSRIVNEYQYGADRHAHEAFIGSPMGQYHPPTSTLGWARLDVRVAGNPWGLPVSEICDGEGGVGCHCLQFGTLPEENS